MLQNNWGQGKKKEKKRKDHTKEEEKPHCYPRHYLGVFLPAFASVALFNIPKNASLESHV